MVQAAEIKIDFLFFSFLVVVLVKEVPGTVLRAYRHFSWYVCNTWLWHSTFQTTGEKYFTGEASITVSILQIGTGSHKHSHSFS